MKPDLSPCGKNTYGFEISGSYGGEYEDENLLGYCAIALMMEAVGTSKTSEYFYQTTRRNIPEGCRIHIYGCLRKQGAEENICT
jgi:hypothetical protein